MDVGADIIGMVKINTKGLCKDTIENITRDCPGGYYLVMECKPMVTGDRTLIAIVYKYNTRKVLYFIVTEDTGSAEAGIPYLSQ